MLAEELTKEYGKGYTKRSLYQYAQFYRMFPEIVQTASAQSFPRLSWSHYIELLRVKDGRARYSVLHGNEQLFASKYKLYLPDEEELRAEIEAQKRIFRAQMEGGDGE